MLGSCSSHFSSHYRAVFVFSGYSDMKSIHPATWNPSIHRSIHRSISCVLLFVGNKNINSMIGLIQPWLWYVALFLLTSNFVHYLTKVLSAIPDQSLSDPYLIAISCVTVVGNLVIVTVSIFLLNDVNQISIFLWLPNPCGCGLALIYNTLLPFVPQYQRILVPFPSQFWGYSPWGFLDSASKLSSWHICHLQLTVINMEIVNSDSDKVVYWEMHCVIYEHV